MSKNHLEGMRGRRSLSCKTITSPVSSCCLTCSAAAEPDPGQAVQQLFPKDCFNLVTSQTQVQTCRTGADFSTEEILPSYLHKLKVLTRLDQPANSLF